jgi:hypothetical protein
MSNQESNQQPAGEKPQPPKTLGKPRKTEFKKPPKNPQV